MTDLASYDNSWYTPGRPRWVQALWFFLGLPVLRSRLLPWSAVRRRLLRLFGAQVGVGVVIKPGVRVKYPWRLVVGNYAWVGEECWIDNLADVRIGSNACVSQGAYLCTGNHDWSDVRFGLVLKGISIGDGGWVGARAIVAPGVVIGEGGVVAAGSVVVRNVPPYEVHAGNPAGFSRMRTFRMQTRSGAQETRRTNRAMV